jgi:hypothetical protein
MGVGGGVSSAVAGVGVVSVAAAVAARAAVPRRWRRGREPRNWPERCLSMLVLISTGVARVRTISLYETTRVAYYEVAYFGSAWPYRHSFW